jgi:hypothetical protein
VEDRPTVSLGPQLDAQNIMSTQINIINNGVLPIRDVSFAIYVKNCKIKGGLEFSDMVIGRYQPPTSVLQAGEPITTTFSFVAGAKGTTIFYAPPNAEYLRFDIALIATFRPTWAPFWKRTRTYRFRVVQTSAGQVMQQFPAEDIEAEYRRSIAH